jgi:hypothetical protein
MNAIREKFYMLMTICYKELCILKLQTAKVGTSEINYSHLKVLQIYTTTNFKQLYIIKLYNFEFISFVGLQYERPLVKESRLHRSSRNFLHCHNDQFSGYLMKSV